VPSSSWPMGWDSACCCSGCGVIWSCAIAPTGAIRQNESRCRQSQHAPVHVKSPWIRPLNSVRLTSTIFVGGTSHGVRLVGRQLRDIRRSSCAVGPSIRPAVAVRGAVPLGRFLPRLGASCYPQEAFLFGHFQFTSAGCAR
jgi:hypothetical protein